MALSSSPQYLVNPRLGAYFGIFSALFVAVFVLGLILAELGAPEGPLRLAAVIAPLVLYAGLGAASVTNRAGDFFGSGRRVPAVYNGAVLAISAAGGVGVVCGTGLIYLHGFDAWAILTGVTAGFVLMAVLFAPYIRKFGAYTLPSFLGRRLDSRFVRVAAAATAAVPILLILIAELRLGVWIARELTGMQERVLLAGLVTTVICCTVLGGMRANTWSGTAQLIACLGALVVLAGVVGIVMTNFPVAQLSYGPVLRSIGRIETGLAISDAQVAPWAFRIAANELAAPIGQMAEPFSSIGAASFVLTTLTVMAGTAAAPWLLPRCTTPPGVHAARKSIGWAVFFAGAIFVTLSAAAVFFRDTLLTTLVGSAPDALPLWFQRMVSDGTAAVTSSVPALPASAFEIHRDAVLFALPAAMGFSEVLTFLVFAGALAAVLAATANAALGLGLMLTEDVFGGLRWAAIPDGLRIAIARVSIVAVLLFAAVAAQVLATDPLQLVLWAIGLSASTAFPVTLLCIWEKRLTPFSAILGLASGFGAGVFGIVALSPLMPSMAQPAFAAIGLPVALVVMLAANRITGSPSRAALEFARDMRIPGGETIYDREARLQRLKAQSDAR